MGQPRIPQVDPGQDGPAGAAPLRVVPMRVTSVRSAGPGERGVDQHGTGHDGAVQVGLIEIGAAEDGVGEDCSGQDRSRRRRFGQYLGSKLARLGRWLRSARSRRAGRYLLLSESDPSQACCSTPIFTPTGVTPGIRPTRLA